MTGTPTQPKPAAALFLGRLTDQEDAGRLDALLKQEGVEPAVNEAEQSLNGLTEPRRLLLALYLHVYAALRSKDLEKDPELLKLREFCGIEEGFVGFLRRGMRLISREIVLQGKNPLESVVHPNGQVQSWAAELVFRAYHEGRFIKKRKLSGLKSKEYEHPLDLRALESLKGTPGLETLTKKLNEYGLERLMKVEYTGSNIRVTEKNLPELHYALRSVCDTLDCAPLPDLYVEMGFINARTFGVEKPIIVLSSSAVGLLTYNELLFILGHEVGHIKSRHMLYHQMAAVIPILGDILGSATLGLGGLLSTGLELALLNWQRKSELTADRAGLLACQSVEAATTTMMKIAGWPVRYYGRLDPADFQKQAAEFEGFDADRLDKVAKLITLTEADHPWTVLRGSELYKWIEAGEYERLMGRKPRSTFESAPPKPEVKEKPKAAPGPTFCTSCGTQLAGTKFCTVCGTKIG